MKQSRRAERMARSNTRARRIPKLNLVALMDIFTILVFFLLVNSSDVQDIPATRSVNLPESLAEAKPRETITVMVTDRDILVQGKPVAPVATVAATADQIISPLQQALQAEAARLQKPTAAGADKGEIMILGDRSIPFQLLKKVMATCTDAGFGRVSLAVVQKAVQGE